MILIITSQKRHRLQLHLRQGLSHAQGYYDDDDRSTDEGMHRIKPGQ